MAHVRAQLQPLQLAILNCLSCTLQSFRFGSENQ